MENALGAVFLNYIISNDTHTHGGLGYGLDDNRKKVQKDNGMSRVDHPAAVPFDNFLFL
jgi:hypothetical protein